ncbi:nuclear pore complex protein Nup214 [Anguilla anguilla]|uniref:nuclear pore complex protein Nup214 n=1 Tax=Anguilla anguilla TaxID=7936 RepID=UPI0015AD5749|nr:nuclear pore complex protein Nup214 [Anguilla anguilla]
MSDDPDAIPEREMKDFQFRQMKKIRVFDSPDDLPKERSSLLAISNKFGLTFVGQDTTLRVFHTRDIIAANKIEGPNDEIVEGVKSLSVSVDLPIHHLALSCDDLTLSVCGTSRDERLLLAFFDIRTFLNKARQEKRPFASLWLSQDAGAAVQDLKWNPGQASVLAACLSDGSMLVLEVTDSATVQAQLPASAGITCVCWSPKGKQVAAGKQNATVIQYTPALQEKKVIPCPPFYTSDNSVKVLDVLWLSTFAFAVVYAAGDGSPETPPELVVVSLPKKDEKRPEMFLNFNDPVYGNNIERQLHYFLTHIEDWDLVLAASAASIEVSIIAKQEDKTNWELWILEDASRAELPVTLNNDDTLPLGVAVDFTCQEEIYISDEKTLPPAPTLMLLSTDGVLCPFSLLNTNPGAKQLSAAPVGLALEGERLPSAGSVAAPPPAAAVGVASAVRPPPTSTPTPAPAAPAAAAPAPAPAPAPAAAASLGFSFNAPPAAASGPGAPAGLSLGSAGFSFSPAPAAKPAAEPPAASAFSFSAPPAKPAAESTAAPSPAPGLAPQRLAAASPVTVLKAPAEPATPAVKVNLNDRFSAAETPAVPPLQQFSFAAAATSTPKPAFPAPSGQSTPLPSTSKPASAPGQSLSLPAAARTAQSSSAPSAVRTAPPTQAPAGTPASQAALSIKALERQLQQRKEVDPVMVGILEEIAHFQKELDDLKARSDKADFRVGTSEEMQGLRTASDDLHGFALEIKETTESLHGDISSLKTTLLEGFAGAEDAKSQSELNKDRGYLQLLYKKPLDPRSEDQLKEIRRLYQYVKFAVEDVNDVLDLEWEKHLEKKKKQRHLIVPEREALFTALSNHLDIIRQQEHKLEVLVKMLQSMRLYGSASSWATPTRPSPTPAPTPTQQGLDSELETLREALLKASLESAAKTPSKSPAKMSPSKQSQLRNFLSKRQTPPVRSTAPANLSRSAFLSPTYYEDLDDVSSASSLSQALDGEGVVLAEQEVGGEDVGEEEPAPPPVPALAVPRHPAVVRTSSVQPGFGVPSALFSKVGPGLGPAVSPVLGGKISVSGADSTAFATKTVKHGAPPAERAPPATVSAQQAAATAALRRQMANQKPGPAVSASLTESTLKTVPQVVNVQELKEKAPPMPVSTVNSSSSPVPASQSLPTNQAKRNSTQSAVKVAAPTGESSASPQPGFMFGAVTSSSAPSLPEQTSKAFSFSAAPAGSFSFASLTASSASASQGGVASQGKDVGQPSKFSFGSGGGAKMVFGAPGETPFAFNPKSASPVLGRTSTPTPPPLGPGAALRPVGSGETLGSFSGLRVGQGEEERPRPASAGFGFGPPDNGPGAGPAEFGFGGAFQQGRPAEPAPPGDGDPPPEPAQFFRPPASVPPPSASPVLSFSSLLAAPLSTSATPPPPAASPAPAPSEDPTPPPAASAEPPPAAETPPPAPPSAQSPAPPAETPPPAEESAPASAPPPAVATEAPAAAAAADAPEKPPTPPTAPAPEPAAAPEPPVSTATEAATAGEAAPPPQPGSIFTQPAPVATDTTLGITALTTVITTVASGSAPTQEAASTVVTTATVFGEPAPAPAAASAAPSGFGSAGFGGASPAAGFATPAFGQPGGFGQPAPTGAGSFSFSQSAFGSAPGFGQPAPPPAAAAAAAAPPPSSSAGGLFGSSGAPSASSFSFGHMTTSAGGSATDGSGGAGLFGQGATPAFGQQSSAFGQSSVFGGNTTTTSSSGFSFGQPAAFGSTSTPSVFGQQGTTSTVFGQAGSGGALFGSGPSGAAGGSAGAGGGFFSGLGGKPSEDAANKNPFGSTTSGGFGQANQTGSSSLFGNSGAKAFGFGAGPGTAPPSFGEPKPSGTFSTGVGSVAAQGFGSFTSPAKTGGFGSAPVFGSPPAFGGSPSFGGASAFGAAPSFSTPLAPAPAKVFGEGTAAANVGGFGFASASNAPTFGSLANQSAPSFGGLANQNAPSFGSLAQQGPGFGSQGSGFPGFGSPAAFPGGGFGSTNQQNPRWPGLQ